MARATVSAGVSLPSEAVVWTCRSTGKYGPPATPRLFGVVDHPRLADDRHLDLSRVIERVFDALDDVPAESPGGVFVHLIGLDHDADLTPRLERIRLFNTSEAERHVFQRLDALDVVVHVLAPRTGARGGDGVGRRHQKRLHRAWLDLEVMRLHRVDDALREIELLE